MVPYLELAPPPHLADSVECFWTMESEQSFGHRVLPDGCADIIFTRDSSKVSLIAVGTMTRFADFQILPGQFSLGARFRPGMGAEQLDVPAADITDALVPLESLWGVRARTLLAQLADCVSPVECAEVLGQVLRSPKARTPVQRALAWMEANSGCVSLDKVALQTGLSARQFRRICRQQIGVSPKLLARVLRFRKALGQLRDQAGEHAGLAADCGYFDQSHFIAEFQRFAGQTPAAYLRTSR
jgi:AraC-like DNA-binding protein